MRGWVKWLGSTATAAAAAFSVWAAGGAASAGKARFGESDLQALLRHDPRTGAPVDSIEALLPLLPRELRANFTFVYDSRSPFKGSITPRYPRVILFSHDGRLILTFTGDPRAPGADLLETMSFDDAGAKFVPRSYVLPAAQRRGFVPSPAASDCARCHGADARPIYDSYPLWPGFYGSVLDTFPHDKLGVAEAKAYAAFLAGPARTGVYRQLVFPKGSPTTPYLDPKHFRNDTVELDQKAFPFLPNARLGMALTELNRKRLYRKLSAGPAFRRNEKRILAELLECRRSARPGAPALARIRALLVTENLSRLKRLGTDARDPKRDMHDMQELAFVQELAEIDRAAALAGVDRADWSMAMEPGSLAFFDGILSGIWGAESYYLKEDLIYEILARLAEREPAFRRTFRYDSVFAAFGYPFGRRVDIGRALQACPMLAPAPKLPPTAKRPLVRLQVPGAAAQAGG